MAGYNNKGNFSSNRGRKSFNPRGHDRAERNDDRPNMHKAVCSNCGKNCEVPFRPTGERPIFCNDCFRKKDGDRENFRDHKSRDHRPRFEDRTRPNTFGGENNSNLKAQLEQINTTLIKILKALTQQVSEVTYQTDPIGDTEFKKANLKEVDKEEVRKAVVKAKDFNDKSISKPKKKIKKKPKS